MEKKVTLSISRDHNDTFKQTSLDELASELSLSLKLQEPLKIISSYDSDREELIFLIHE